MHILRNFCNSSDKSASAVSSVVSPLTFLESNVGDDKSTFSEKKEKEKKRKTGVEYHGMIVVF